MKKTFALILILALVFCMAVPTFAAPSVAGAAKTTVGIQVYDYDPDNLTKSVSYTVPLYVTLAVTKDEGAVQPPSPAEPIKSKIIVPGADKYQITNTAPGGRSIAVTKLDVTKLVGSKWTLNTDPSPSVDHNLYMALGAGNNKVVLREGTIEEENGFITPATSKNVAAAPIAVGHPLSLDITAAIRTKDEHAKADAAPQFTIAYTLQPLNPDNTLVSAANVYVGDNFTEAGYATKP